MKISYNWLQKYFKEKLPEPEVIAQGIIFHAFEIEEQENVGDDTIFDIKILPDRAHDCLSHWGIAKEISAIFDIKIDKDVEEKYKTLEGNGGLVISVLNDNCRRYMGRIVKGVKVSSSPSWLSDALISIGQKSINNIVDATNYVMFDLGNPIHAFDLDKLASPKIIIDNAKQDEKFILLDGREVILDENMLTIRDEKEALVVAGVKGGKKAEIDSETTNIMIEVANFEPVTVRKTAKRLGIFTDSAKRFENEISPFLSSVAMDKITSLILEVAGGEAYDVVDVNNSKEDQKSIIFLQSYINKMLGVNISKEIIEGILNRFNYDYKNEGEIYTVKVSTLRLDMNGPCDVVEEIGRIYGYEKITPVLPKINFEIKENKTWVNMMKARDFLVADGYREVMNYAFADKGDVEIMASASDKNFLRTNLTDGMKKSFELNKLNISFLGDKEIKIFEIGTIFTKNDSISAQGYGEIKEEMHVAYWDKKNQIEMELEKFISLNSLSNSFPQVLGSPRKEIGELGQTSSEKNNSSEISEKGTSEVNSYSQVFKPWSLFPFISRDIAVWVPNEVESYQVYKVINENAGELLIKEPYLFDSFTKEGRTSYAYRLVFQSYNRTLKDEEINPIMDIINKKISSLGWEVR